MNIKHYLLLSTAFCTLNVMAQKPKMEQKKPTTKAPIDKSTMDFGVKPTHDFYRYANGTWLKENPVPSTESRWGNFNLVAERNNLVLRNTLENLAKTPQVPNSIEDKIATFYKLYVDTNKRKSDGVTKTDFYLGRIAAISNTNEMFELIAEMHSKGFPGLFRFGVSQDAKNSQVYIPQLSQGGFGLPDKDFYFKTDEKSTKIRN